LYLTRNGFMLTAIMTGCLFLAAHPALQRKAPDLPPFSAALLLLMLSAANIAFLSKNFLGRYVALEVVGLGIALAPLLEVREGARLARWVYLLLRLGDVGLLLAILVLHRAAGTLDINAALSASLTLPPALLAWIVGGFVLAGVGQSGRVAAALLAGSGGGARPCLARVVVRCGDAYFGTVLALPDHAIAAGGRPVAHLAVFGWGRGRCWPRRCGSSNGAPNGSAHRCSGGRDRGIGVVSRRRWFSIGGVVADAAQCAAAPGRGVHLDFAGCGAPHLAGFSGERVAAPQFPTGIYRGNWRAGKSRHGCAAPYPHQRAVDHHTVEEGGLED
jgi:hypothetical protein